MVAIKIENALDNVEIACLQPNIIFRGQIYHSRVILLISCTVSTKNSSFKNFRL